jgi:hypothetical protein
LDSSVGRNPRRRKIERMAARSPFLAEAAWIAWNIG